MTLDVAATPRAPVGEQWTILPSGLRNVRNVTVPTLTPVLPPPDRATGAAVIIAPGGGFVSLSIDSEGYEVARWLAARGIAAFVLKYRLEPTPPDPAGLGPAAMAVGRRLIPTGDAYGAGSPDAAADATTAVAYVRAHAAQFGVMPGRIGLIGFSAGAIAAMSATVGSAPEKRPDFLATIYGAMNAPPVPPDAPPLFTAIALDDPLFAMRRNLSLIEAWRKAGRPIEAHLYERGGHGFGMHAQRAAAALWIEEFHAWLQDRGIVAPRKPVASGSARDGHAPTPAGKALADR